VRIEKGESVSRPEIRSHEGLEKRRLAGAGLADDIHVGEPVTLLDAEKPPVIPEVGFGEQGDRT
jgi:hypothetical protein